MSKKVIIFTKGPVPNKYELELAVKYNTDVFRNSMHVNTDDDIELCDEVYGHVPYKYKIFIECQKVSSNVELVNEEIEIIPEVKLDENVIEAPKNIREVKNLPVRVKPKIKPKWQSNKM